jgi:aromatic ring hydroxylase
VIDNLHDNILQKKLEDLARKESEPSGGQQARSSSVPQKNQQKLKQEKLTKAQSKKEISNELQK